jgi:tetratricopeptide (TPR) repeat protein
MDSERRTALDSLTGRYRIERELGRDGTATVYLAEDLKLHRQVALKVLHAEPAESLGAERFAREIDTIARLTHPHILALYDSGAVDGRLFYAMPYVAGESLRERLRREPQLPLGETVAIVRAVAEALDYAHGTGVIHRDIKPENILLPAGPHGGSAHALLADCGIARALDVVGARRLTEAGLALGTPSYMSPEQAEGSAQLDGRSDVYSLGCVAYEMLAGVPPFTGPTAQVILARHAVDPMPSLRTVRATVPKTVERAIARALAKTPADRFATAGEFAAALAASTAPPHGERHLLRRVLWAVVLVTCVAAGALGSWMYRTARTHRIVAPASRIVVLPLAAPTGDTGLVRLGRDLAVTISTSLDGVGGLQIADRLAVANNTADRPSLSVTESGALAKRLGASSVLRGTLLDMGSDVVVELGLFAAADNEPLAEGIRVIGPRDSLATLTDSVTWALLRRTWQRGKPPSPSLGAVTTRSVPALRAFLDGERELDADRWEEAALAFRSAIAADSTFWLAYYRYALAQDWQLAPREPKIIEALRLHRDQLPERERLLVAVDLDSMPLSKRLQRFGVIVAQFPDYWPAWFEYGDLLAHFGPRVGRDVSEAIGAFRRVVALDPRCVPAWDHLHALATGRDQAEADHALVRLGELGARRDGPLARLFQGVAHAGGVIPPHLDGLADSLAEIMASGHQFVARFNFPEGLVLVGTPIAHLDLNRRALTSASLTPGPQPRVPLLIADAQAWAARGQWDSALAIMSEAAGQVPGMIGGKIGPENGVGGFVIAEESYGLAVVGAWLGATPPALADERRAAAVRAVASVADEELRADARGRLAWLDGLLGYARGDRRAIEGARRAAARSGYSQAKVVDRSLGAFDLALAGDRASAGRDLAMLEEQCADNENCGMGFTPHIAVERFAAAQWLHEAGEMDRAARLLRWQDAWVVGGGFFWGFSEVLEGPTQLLRGRLEEAREGGQPERARRFYQRFLQLYDSPLPAQAHLVDEARGALARLERKR